MSPRPDRSVGRSPTASCEGGFTLPELLVAVVIASTLIFSISTAFMLILRTSDDAETRLAESKDITFVQTWLPVDLSSAVESFDTPDDVELQNELAALTPPLAFATPLGGTNVLTLVRPDLEAGGGVYYVVSYRYENINGDWQLTRYEIRDPGGPGETSKRVGVAHEVPDPPPSWNPGEAPTFAVEVRSRNQVILRPIGEDVYVNFQSGNEFATGGAGLSAENQLPVDYSGGFTDPSAPPSRCGGRIAMVIDTSGSVPASGGGVDTEIAATGFIDAFTGTPTTFSINGFDREAYGMLTATPYFTNGERAPFESVLNAGPSVDALTARIAQLDDLDGAWPGGGAPLSQRDPNGDGVMWDQLGSGTNWEDGLYTIFRRNDGTYYGVDQPDLLVFITDGEPNRVRTSGGGSTGASNQDATDAAADIANVGRSLGARVIGVMVGHKSNNPTYVGYLKDVVGDLEWDGWVNPDGTVEVGNAVAADLFKGNFDDLGGILRSIMIAECGGTLTLQKRIDVSGTLTNPATGVWSYTTDLGVRELDRSQTSSITFDYTFGPSEASKTVQITEQPVPGYVWDRAECSAGGNPVASLPNADGSPGATVTVEADKAVSCLMISTPA